MIEHEVDVINMSLSWSWSGPGDGTSRLSHSSLRSVEAAVDAGIIWVNSAGNRALDTWFGQFSDTDTDGFHAFQGTDECNNFQLELEAGERLIAMLRWDDSWTAPSSDLDLYLILIEGGQTRIVFRSDTDQNEILKPFEWISGAPINGGNSVWLCLTREALVPDWIQLQAFTGQDLEYSVSERTIVEPADSANQGCWRWGQRRGMIPLHSRAIQQPRANTRWQNQARPSWRRRRPVSNAKVRRQSQRSVGRNKPVLTARCGTRRAHQAAVP